MNKVKQSYWCMEGRHNDEVHCTNCNHAVGVQYDEGITSQVYLRYVQNVNLR